MTLPAKSPTAQLLHEQLAALLDAIADAEPTPESAFIITTRWAGYVSIEPNPYGVLPKLDGSDPLAAFELAVRKALGLEAKTAKAIARATGYKYNSRFRGYMAELIRRRRIERTHEGYRLMMV